MAENNIIDRSELQEYLNEVKAFRNDLVKRCEDEKVPKKVRDLAVVSLADCIRGNMGREERESLDAAACALNILGILGNIKEAAKSAGDN